MFYDDDRVASGRIERTVPGLFSFDEGLDVGLDSLDPVVRDYGVERGVFSGSIDQVVIDTSDDAISDPNLVLKARYRRQ